MMVEEVVVWRLEDAGSGGDGCGRLGESIGMMMMA